MGKTSVDGNTGTPPGQSTPRKTSATYRPWFNLHARTEGALRLAWISTQLNVMKRQPTEILDAVWEVVVKKIGGEITEKLDNPTEFKNLLVKMIQKDPALFENAQEEMHLINIADNLTLKEMARSILLKNYQKEQLMSFIAHLTRKQFILKMECKKIRKELDDMVKEDFRKLLVEKEIINDEINIGQYDDAEIEEAKNSIFDAWVVGRGKELSSESNDYINKWHQKYKRELFDSIRNDCFSESFPDPAFLNHTVCSMGLKDFKELSNHVNVPDVNKTEFNKLLNQGYSNRVSRSNNISNHWWHANLIFLVVSAGMMSLSLTSFTDTRKDKINLFLEEPFQGLEIHDPIFRGVGFGLFALSLISTWLLHPVDQKADDLAKGKIATFSVGH